MISAVSFSVRPSTMTTSFGKGQAANQRSEHFTTTRALAGSVGALAGVISLGDFFETAGTVDPSLLMNGLKWTAGAWVTGLAIDGMRAAWQKYRASTQKSSAKAQAVQTLS